MAARREEGERGPGRVHMEMDESQSQSQRDMTQMVSYLELKMNDVWLQKGEAGEKKLWMMLLSAKTNKTYIHI